jgi:hypothetical protein
MIKVKGNTNATYVEYYHCRNKAGCALRETGVRLMHTS